MEIKNVKIKDLKHYSLNAKKHPTEQIDGIAQSILRFGFTQPIVIDSKNEIIIGHGRHLAAIKLNLDEVPCLMLDDLNEQQVKALRLIDNRIAETGWDNSLLIEDLSSLNDFDFSSFNIDFDFLADEILSGENAEVYEDEAPEVSNGPPITKRGDIWLLGDHRVMCGDSTNSDDVDLLMNGCKADMVFTDPPYGVSYANKNTYLNAISKGNIIQNEIKNDHMNIDKTGDFVYKAFLNIKNILADRSCYYITAPQGGDLMMMMMMMQKAGIPFRHCLIWVKNNHVLGRTDYNYKHEPILYGWDKVHDFYGEGIHKFSTWEIDKPLKNDLHPTMKPVALIENAILNSTKKGMIVADIFGGSGSTLIACENTGRINRTMELDEHYCDVIVKRWQNLTGKEAVLESTGEKFNHLMK